MGTIRLEWLYHSLNGTSTVREACLELLGVHPDLAITPEVLSAARTGDELGRFALRVRLLIQAPALAAKTIRPQDYPHMQVAWAFDSTATGVERKPDLRDTEFSPGWEGRRIEVVEDWLTSEAF
ncbi:MAG: hypothetical protein KF773_12365 [Deltaproteobacteria bacterium]|nr:hypothetical protein [Deltaproteobacteria bacterium]